MSGGRDPFAGMGPSDCRFPLGHPGAEDFRFCRGPSDLGRPYCAEHLRVAYYKPQASAKLSAAWTEDRRAKARARLLRLMAAE